MFVLSELRRCFNVRERQQNKTKKKDTHVVGKRGSFPQMNMLENDWKEYEDCSPLKVCVNVKPP